MPVFTRFTALQLFLLTGGLLPGTIPESYAWCNHPVDCKYSPRIIVIIFHPTPFNQDAKS